MRYLGGKSEIAEVIAEIIKGLNHLEVNEPFCGGLWITEALSKRGITVRASDICEPLINLYLSVRAGWIPPEYVSEKEYRELKKRAKDGEVDDPMIAFAGFAGSWGGKWYGGYARGKENRNYFAEGRNWLLKYIPQMTNVSFQYLHYRNVLKDSSEKSLIYCDPPYAGTTGYQIQWDPAGFWWWCREKAKEGHIILVSEFSAPSDFRLLWEQDRHTMGNKVQTEKLFMKVS